MITQEHLKSILNYNPETGIFTWLKRPEKSIIKVGSNACYTHPNTGYCHINIDRKFNASHRLAWLYMTGSFPKNCIDHINRVKNDNRWLNLRDVTQGENGRNQKMKENNTSGFTGVHLRKDTGKWRVYITYKGDRHYFGCYKTKEEAVEVRAREIKQFDFSPTHGI